MNHLISAKSRFFKGNIHLSQNILSFLAAASAPSSKEPAILFKILRVEAFRMETIAEALSFEASENTIKNIIQIISGIMELLIAATGTAIKMEGTI